MGGHWGAELKFAGWDNVIIEGKADKPVWISIIDDKVEIRDAAQLWGNGIYRTTVEIMRGDGLGRPGGRDRPGRREPGPRLRS